jgi:hypothetical protein
LSDQIVRATTVERVRSQRLIIHAVDVAQVLMPVVSTLHRRRCQITALSYAVADDDGGCGYLEIRLQCSSGRLDTVPRWLANIVGVLEVEELT